MSDVTGRPMLSSDTSVATITIDNDTDRRKKFLSNRSSRTRLRFRIAVSHRLLSFEARSPISKTSSAANHCTAWLITNVFMLSSGGIFDSHSRHQGKYLARSEGASLWANLLRIPCPRENY